MLPSTIEDQKHILSEMDKIVDAKARKKAEEDLIKRIKDELKDSYEYSTKQMNILVDYYTGKSNPEDDVEMIEEVGEAVATLKGLSKEG